ncbi:MAG: hypothetical protein FWG15_05060 [Propionibacteriaceae bacterium]|nr:hypothetical protein [Propionibacteriaceae bacterium]
MTKKRTWRFRKPILIITLVVSLICLGAIGRVGWIAGSSPRNHVMGQLHYLDSALDRGAARSMQGLFPEGEFFTWVLTGVAAGRVANDPSYSPEEQAFARYLAERTLFGLDDPSLIHRFGDIPELDHGIFYRGWRLTLLNEIGAWDEKVHTQAQQEAREILRAVDDSTSGWVDSYPNQAWPCDTVVGLGAAKVAAPEEAAPVISRWLDRIDHAIDPDTGLLAHSVDHSGVAREPARGSSQSIIATFWPLITDDTGYWATYSKNFVTTRLGIVGVREYPGGHGRGDVDSGPLIFGMSPSASAVTQAAARAHGDITLATSLDKEIELLGIPWGSDKERTYLFGAMPVAVGFFVWADTTPLGTEIPTQAPRPTWFIVSIILALPAALMWGVAFLFRRRV